ncbi:hypothetical protein E4U40_005124 [Claviceps sp. LM458 group G5]|nr:hypothetical protein E4U40_005124 [Claviceps sp. LM458 group G5]KAG6042368.1 hypothetical protein E4U39_006036 [Claviceps sp. Clav50 group G5]
MANDKTCALRPMRVNGHFVRMDRKAKAALRQTGAVQHRSLYPRTDSGSPASGPSTGPDVDRMDLVMPTSEQPEPPRSRSRS